MGMILKDNKKYNISKFNGGEFIGNCIQINTKTNKPYLQLTLDEVDVFIENLMSAKAYILKRQSK